MSDNQAEADTQDSTVADPLDAANSTNSGTNELDAYEASVQAALNAVDDDEEQGVEPADVEADEFDEFADVIPEEEDEGQVNNFPDEEEEPEAKAKDRFRFKNADDQAVAAIAKARGVSLVEAAKIYAGDPAPIQRQEAEEAYQEPVETVSSVQNRLDELEELEAEASSLMEFEAASGYRKETKKLLNSLMDLKIAEVQSKAQAEQKSAQAFDQQFHATKDKFIGFYPDAASAFNGSREKTPMAKEILRLDAEMRAAGDPIFSHPDKAEVLIKQAAYNLKIPMNKPGSVPAKKTVQHRPIQPANGNARTITTDPAKRAADAIAGIRTSDEFERLVASM
jgi:hypothetical protein